MKFSSGYGQKRGVRITTKVVFFLLPIFAALAFAVPAFAANGDISGRVYEDLNLNKLADVNETGLADWRVNLYENGVLTASIVTDSEGRYVFEDLADGDYTVSIERDSRWAAVGGQSRQLKAASGRLETADFGFFRVLRDDYIYGPITQISTVSVEQISSTEVKISWFTNLPAVGSVVFGPSAKSGIALASDSIAFGYDSSTGIDFTAKTYHQVILDRLDPDQRYYFRIVILPDPLQWRGCAYVLSDEMTFFGGDALVRADVAGDTSGDGDGETAKIAPAVKPAKSAVLARPGKILSEELAPDELALIDEQQADAEPQATENISDQPGFFGSCAPYIWLLILANLAAIAGLYGKFKDSENESVRKIWWMIVIISLVPVILEYPSCALIGWLLLTMAASLGIIFFLKPNIPEAGKGKDKKDEFLIDPDSIEYGDRAGRTDNKKHKEDN